MGHKSKKSLVRQVQEVLQAKLCPGDSKHMDKNTPEGTSAKLYSFGTYRTYMNVGIKFARFCKENHGCKNLDQCRQYVNEYLEQRGNSCSAYTVKLDAAALGKIYGESTTSFIRTESRSRGAVTRSRGAKAMDRHFSASKNMELVSFLKSSGLRRSEAAHVRGSDLRPCSASPVGLGVFVRSSGAKGGRERVAPLFCSRQTAKEIADRCAAVGDKRLFTRIHSKLDVHSLRAEYGKTVYLANARPIDKLLPGERYYCRNDMKGLVLDRHAMRICSHALGHNRLQVSTHYLYGLQSQ